MIIIIIIIIIIIKIALTLETRHEIKASYGKFVQQQQISQCYSMYLYCIVSVNLYISTHSITPICNGQMSITFRIYQTQPKARVCSSEIKSN